MLYPVKDFVNDITSWEKAVLLGFYHFRCKLTTTRKHSNFCRKKYLSETSEEFLTNFQGI